VAAVLCLAALAPSFAGGHAFASGPSFAGRPAAGQRPSQVTHGFANAPVRQSGIAHRPTRIVRRFFVPVYGGYAPYYEPTLPEEQPAGAPVIVETETPVNVTVGVPADQFAAPPVCNGPQIIELGKPKKTQVRLPRVIYGTPLSCIAARAPRRGPGIYSVD